MWGLILMVLLLMINRIKQSYFNNKINDSVNMDIISNFHDKYYCQYV